MFGIDWAVAEELWAWAQSIGSIHVDQEHGVEDAYRTLLLRRRCSLGHRRAAANQRGNEMR